MNTQVEFGKILSLKVKNQRPEGWLLQAGTQLVILPNEEAPKGLKAGDFVSVVIYLNQQGEPVVSSKIPYAQVGDNASLRIVQVTQAGAFLDWGLPKDLFLPRSKQLRDHEVGENVFVKVEWDSYSNRLACSELPEDLYSNANHELKEFQQVELELLKETPLGFQMIINRKHIGLLYHNEVFKPIYPGDTLKGYIKRIKDNDLIDLALGKPGHERVEDETGLFLRRLREAGGFLPFHDKTDPETIYKEFQMSKKAFKMMIGKLYKQQKITILPSGVELKSR
ncbi:S1-like domain-containing RNA-binding protein [Bacteroidota bacterium]